MRLFNLLAIPALAAMGLCPTAVRAQTASPTFAPPGILLELQAPQIQNWSGTLIDADCKAKTPTDKCEVSSLTRSFGLQTADGKYVTMDSDGNQKVQKALESTQEKTGAIKVSVSGTLDGTTLKVDTIQIR